MKSHLLIVGLLVSLVVAAESRAAGLLVPSDRTLPPLRITDHVVDVQIRDQIAITDVRQTFYNDTDRRLEATYVFPLPENGDLTDFQMTFNGKMVQGRVLPADEARQVYESIVRQAKDPGLIEFIGRRLLQMRVFPIEPKCADPSAACTGITTRCARTARTGGRSAPCVSPWSFVRTRR
ncbi:MAG: VIT domain-containing protein [Planctomycetota bacterium]|jgi:Ca-activated chloride channel family protein